MKLISLTIVLILLLFLIGCSKEKECIDIGGKWINYSDGPGCSINGTAIQLYCNSDFDCNYGCGDIFDYKMCYNKNYIIKKNNEFCKLEQNDVNHICGCNEHRCIEDIPAQYDKPNFSKNYRPNVLYIHTTNQTSEEMIKNNISQIILDDEFITNLEVSWIDPTLYIVLIYGNFGDFDIERNRTLELKLYDTLEIIKKQLIESYIISYDYQYT